MRFIWISAVLLSLSGCALPVAVSIASLALDAGSYLASGKTVTDHGLSMVMDKDCALLRVVEGPICEEEADYEVELATLTPLPESGTGAMETDLASDAEAGAPPSDPVAPGRWVQVAAHVSDEALFGGDYLAAEMMSIGL